ncbi:MAG: hypothetical protein ACJAS9_000554 [Polaribacter sp.]|jgi:hypothetical protein
MKKYLKFKSLFLVTSLLVLVGCASPPPPPSFESYFSPYTSGALQGKGIRIEAEDGSFVIEEGKFTPPFQTYHTYQTGLSKVLYFKTYTDGTSPGSLLDSFGLALKHGAKKVIVYHPDAKQPLYGVLLLNKKLTDSATGPAARSYLIRIPASYVNSAKGGRVSVVYEPVSRKGSPKAKNIGWAIWLSDSPF